MFVMSHYEKMHGFKTWILISSRKDVHRITAKTDKIHHMNQFNNKYTTNSEGQRFQLIYLWPIEWNNKPYAGSWHWSEILHIDTDTDWKHPDGR